MSKEVKKVVTSTKSGVGVYRDSQGNFNVGLSSGDNSGITQVIDEEESGLISESKCSPLNTKAFCGGITPTSMSSVLNLPQKGNISAKGSIGVSAEEEIEEIPCDGDIIVATRGNFDLFYLNPDPEVSVVPYYKSLGGNAGHVCIETLIGIVQVISTGGYILTRIPRWAFEENRRILCINTKYSWRTLRPAWPPFIDDHNSTWSLIYPRMLCPHYGIPSTSGALIVGSGANVGGVGEDFEFLKFGLQHYITSAFNVDFSMWDSMGIDVPNYSASSVRIIPIADPVDCTTTVEDLPTADNNKRIRAITNIDRVCESYTDPLQDDTVAQQLADDYAQNMAENDFVSHIDPNSGETFEDRLDAYGLPQIDAAEVLGACTGVYEDPDQACLDLFETWKSSQDHYDALMSVLYTRVVFGIAYNSETKKWYGCGILRNIEEDDYSNGFSVVLPDAPEIWNGVFEDSDNWNVSLKGNSYTAFSSRPMQNLELSCIAYQHAKAVSYPTFLSDAIILSMRDIYNFGISGDTLSGPGDYGTLTGPIFEYPDSWPYAGAQKRRQGEASGWVPYYIEYDNTTGGRSVMLKLYDINNSADNECIYNGETYPRSQSNPYEEGDKLPDGSEWQGDKEVENEYVSSEWGGETELFVGSTFINDSSDTGSGPNVNPFRSIVVGSVFHSNSGYTVITYTRTKTLRTTATYWDCPEGEEVQKDTVYERYWYVKQTLWCAVVDPTGTRIANFEVKATIPPDRTESNWYTRHVYILQQASEEEIQLQTFFFQLNGDIKVGTVEVWFKFGGRTIYLSDNSKGGLYEIPNQDPNNETLVASSEIDYQAGLVTIGFSSNKPDPSTDVVVNADVWPFDEMYGSIALYSEFGDYMSPGGHYSSGDYHAACLLGVDGHDAVNPQATITEDGHYLVIGLRVGKTSCDRVRRPSKDQNGGTNGDNLDYVTYNSSTNVKTEFEDFPHQILIYDMFDISLSEPKIVGKPFLMSKIKQPTATVVLN